MKKPFILLFLFSVLSPFLYARVNITEQWKPGIDTEIMPKDKYLFGLDANMASSNNQNIKNYFTIPAVFTYGTSRKTEIGASLGLISTDNNSGINDLIIALKYQFTPDDKTKNTDQPIICGELGLALPTGDYKRGLGTGGVGMLLSWMISKKLKDINAYFDLAYTLNSTNPDKYKYGNVLSYIIGIEYPYPKKELLLLYCELKGYNHESYCLNENAMQNTSFQELYFAPGIKYDVSKQFDVYCSINFGMTSNSSNIRVFVGGIFKH